MDTNLQPVTIDDFETFDFSQITHLYKGEEYSSGVLSISNLSYNGEELTYINDGTEENLSVSSGVTSTRNYPLMDYLTKSFE